MELEALGKFYPCEKLVLLILDRKSQIVIEYCYIWKDRYLDGHVFWVHASTFDRFEQAYRDIAKEMSIPGTRDLQNNTLIII